MHAVLDSPKMTENYDFIKLTERVNEQLGDYLLIKAWSINVCMFGKDWPQSLLSF